MCGDVPFGLKLHLFLAFGQNNCFPREIVSHTLPDWNFLPAAYHYYLNVILLILIDDLEFNRI